IATRGWRGALVALGGALAVTTTMLALLYREPPAAGERAAGIAHARSIDDNDWSLRRAVRSVRLWAAVSMTALGVIGYQIMATHQVAHAVDRGFQPTTVVWLFAFGAGCMMAGNLLGGWLSDHLGRAWGFALGFVGAIIGIGCLAAVSGPSDLALLVLYTASGFGFCMRIAHLS